MVPYHQVLSGCRAEPECFRLAKEAVAEQFAKAALDVGTDAEQSEKVSEADANTAPLGPEVATANTV